MVSPPFPYRRADVPPEPERPPSTTTCVPVVLDDKSEHKKMTVFAISSGSAYRPAGIIRLMAAWTDSGSPGFRCDSSDRIIRVYTGQGHTAFTRTPSAATSVDATLVNPRTPCLDAT